ncbi:MAG: 50S ribosomal protein L3 [Candidatus Anoxymicrobium japonicum]|uniref:Large ribosomal subunit protein uL3 n=1 Tax=Candidatus Anoxymicrobium japonicum TaxID=2013648 RepID=A0A2N3G5W8_9ACTN|nr:ribosomal protein L3 [uncultured bacterium]PKQ28110.1 MAG: 50S ribosomal protein L3 [Candidatus Anoxymicrobium japonicum]
MNKAIIGEKLGMTQLFKDDLLVPVTVLRVGPCVVTQLKSKEKDGYEAVQVGFGEIPHEKVERKINMPMRGHFNKAKVPPQRFLAELPLDPKAYKVGARFAVEFKEGDHADVTSVSKGKGFAGVVKRYGFAGGPASHGSRFHRAPGSIGQCASPSKVFKGKKLPGRMGGEKVTVLNLQVVEVDSEKGLMMVKGAVPGVRGGIVLVRESVKAGGGKGKR